MSSCVAYGCTNRRSKKIPGLTFHAFPKDPKHRDLWVAAVRRKNWVPSYCSKLCSEHFSEDMIDRTSLSVVRLKENAVPTIFKAFPKYLQKDTRPHEKNKSVLVKSQEKSSNKNSNEEKSYLNKTNEPANDSNLTSNKSEVKQIEDLPSIFELNLCSYVNKSISKTGMISNSPSSKDQLEYVSVSKKDLEKENNALNIRQEQEMPISKNNLTYEKLIESMQLIKKPNRWWTISSVNNFIVCARWNPNYAAEKKIVIEKSLITRVFLNELEVDITNFMDITSIKDISYLMEKVENYNTS